MDPIQIFTVTVAILSLWLSVDMTFRFRERRRYLIPVIVYLVHVIVFYTFRTLTAVFGILPNYQDYFSFTQWSTAVRFQGVFTILYFLFILGRYDMILCERLKDTRVGKRLWKSGCKP